MHPLQRDAEQFFLFFLDDDARRDHQHQAFRFAADAGVLEETADVRNLVQDRHAGHRAAFAQPLHAAEQHRSAVGHADGRRDVDDFEYWLLHGDRRRCSLSVLTGLSALTALPADGTAHGTAAGNTTDTTDTQTPAADTAAT